MNARAIRAALRVDPLAQPILSHIQVGLVIVGGLFWAMAVQQAEAFDAAMYGDFALLFPAEAWAMAMMGPSAMVWIGLRDPIKRWMVIAGSVLQIIQFCGLGYSAMFTGGEPIIGVFCVVFFAPIYAYILGAAVNDP